LTRSIPVIIFLEEGLTEFNIIVPSLDKISNGFILKTVPGDKFVSSSDNSEISLPFNT